MIFCEVLPINKKECQYFTTPITIFSGMASPERTIRVIFVGNTNAGKTVLTMRILNNVFQEDFTPTLSPAMMETTVKTQNDSEVTLQLWDTAGQERFQSLSQVFYRDSNIAVICCSSVEKDSIASISMWYNRVISHEPRCMCVVALTKIDLVKTDQERNELMKECKNIMGQHSIKQLFVTSALSGEGVVELKMALANNGMEQLSSNTPNTSPRKTVDINSNNNNSQNEEKKGCC